MQPQYKLIVQSRVLATRDIHDTIHSIESDLLVQDKLNNNSVQHTNICLNIGVVDARYGVRVYKKMFAEEKSFVLHLR